MSSNHPNGSPKAGVLRRVWSHLFRGRSQEVDGYVNRHGYSHIDDATIAMFGLGRMDFGREPRREPRY